MYINTKKKVCDRMSHLFPNYNKLPFEIVEGQGAYVKDQQGKEYLDLTSGIGVVNLGYGHPEVQQALLAQAEKLWHMPNLYESQLQETVAAQLVQQIPHTSEYAVYFCNSGAEANEAALKLARKATGRSQILSFQQSFHGRTFGAMSATGQAAIQDGFGPLVPGFTYLTYNDEAALAQALSADTAAVIIELIQGEGGVIPAEKEWVQAVAAHCKENGTLLIIDEIQTGMGRTGTFYAFEQYDIEPDMFTLAKGLGNGIPVGALVGKAALKSAFGPGSHGSTFGGNKLAMAAAAVVCQQIAAPSLQGNVQARSAQLLAGLKDLPTVQAVRGSGLMIGLVLKDADTLQQVMQQLREAHVLALKAGTQVLRLLPPLTITEEETAAGIAILRSILG